MLRRNSPSRNGAVAGRAGLRHLLGALGSGSAHARRALAARGVCNPRRPQVLPLSWLVSDHLHRLHTIYDDRCAREHVPWRSVVAQFAEK